MSTVTMQAMVGEKIVQIVLLPDAATAKIYIVNHDGSSHPPRTMGVQEYLDSGMSSEETVRHILAVVSETIEQVERSRGH
ncbi:hypothetical protein [Burkholderia ambifaria]|jgi:hypothetical protein|uniref:hypothetical protein n=1 Tax=Burkholderia ambifaria TaxID=152480 RepID=UPI0015936B5A|nr:hypothetical protein [Burkholderia ambifaria]